jgi:hypothetical protein
LRKNASSMEESDEDLDRAIGGIVSLFSVLRSGMNTVEVGGRSRGFM